MWCVIGKMSLNHSSILSTHNFISFQRKGLYWTILQKFFFNIINNKPTNERTIYGRFSQSLKSHDRKNSNREWNWSVSGSLLPKAVLLEWIDQSLVFSHFHPSSNLYISKSQGNRHRLFLPLSLTLFDTFPRTVSCLLVVIVFLMVAAKRLKYQNGLGNVKWKIDYVHQPDKQFA